MDMIFENLNLYVRSELMVLIPALYILIKIIDKSKLSNERIPIIIALVAIILCGLYIFSVSSISSWRDVLFAIFSSTTQGILIAGASIWGNMIVKQCTQGKCKENKQNR